ncbi:alpha-L RNA-binding motif-containing protein [Basidiobolus meristosporus CBS 931.73]|uniref:Alpha-L RNA-binding motif-containing protein n=1 Tax=Basidiobolus meristosporus CBS 931.73 TaxID=1314790 RepID=A0A1Y1XB82_9FUNG|nr:alpha-L RNA-binding motif-containing protein [Basidiobolus meristosporus CBS 931.73]|eukprot:ORX83010.1 alpha-L RNA-binding motif-containing protein [Basidiobolus meristosporus CBS 931.73]
MSNKTLYQQRWQAKKDTRGYHGQYVINERQWKAMFKPNLPTANTKLGGDDRVPHPSVASLTFAEMERRLDFIIFRSHFCSSINQARQAILHGNVYVNEKKLPYPSHRVKDGDVVRIEPSAVCTLSGTPGQELTFTPKPYQQPWMFLPDYLEVNYNTCSTIFLRSPISKPGKVEVPSPFPPEVHALAYEFYVKKGKTS